MRRATLLSILISVSLSASSIGRPDRLSNEVDAVLDYIYTLDSSQSRVDNILSDLVQVSTDKLKRKNEYGVYALIYVAYIMHGNEDFMYGSWCKQALSLLIQDSNRIRSFLQIAEDHYEAYRPAIKVLLLKAIHIILDTRSHPKRNPVRFLNVLSGDSDPDISKAAKILLLRYK